MIFSKVTIGADADLRLIEAELRLDPVTCMSKAQDINAGSIDDSHSMAACMPILWDDDVNITPEILEKH
tara:strand:+ start:1351 stop:1557 length:207 start_codon:yes stop_codon:yes gene_type:complete